MFWNQYIIKGLYVQIHAGFNSDEPLVNYEDSKLKLSTTKPSQNLTLIL